MMPDANVVLRGRARKHAVREYPGPLSVKTVQRGRAVWQTAEGAFAVDESTFLVLNDGQEYSLEVDSPEAVETCCVFFRRGFVESVWGNGPAEFPTRLWAPDERIQARIRAIYQAGPCDRVEDHLVVLAGELAGKIREARGERMRAPGLRAATREELYRRLLRARDYLHDRYLDPVTLEDAARVACVSPYHFHRGFSRVFGESPHQYRTRLRLERARHLLGRGEMAVTEVCLDCGFESLGSFSALFRRRFGVSPRQAKKQD